MVCEEVNSNLHTIVLPIIIRVLFNNSQYFSSTMDVLSTSATELVLTIDARAQERHVRRVSNRHYTRVNHNLSYIIACF